MRLMILKLVLTYLPLHLDVVHELQDTTALKHMVVYKQSSFHLDNSCFWCWADLSPRRRRASRKIRNGRIPSWSETMLKSWKGKGPLQRAAQMVLVALWFCKGKHLQSSMHGNLSDISESKFAKGRKQGYIPWFFRPSGPENYWRHGTLQKRPATAGSITKDSSEGLNSKTLWVLNASGFREIRSKWIKT